MRPDLDKRNPINHPDRSPGLENATRPRFTFDPADFGEPAPDALREILGEPRTADLDLGGGRSPVPTPGAVSPVGGTRLLDLLKTPGAVAGAGGTADPLGPRMPLPERPDYGDLDRRTRAADIAAIVSAGIGGLGALFGGGSPAGTLLMALGEGGAEGAAGVFDEAQRARVQRADDYLSVLRDAKHWNRQQDVADARERRTADRLADRWAREDEIRDERHRREDETAAEKARRDAEEAQRARDEDRLEYYLASGLDAEAVSLLQALMPDVTTEQARAIVAAELDERELARRGKELTNDRRRQLLNGGGGGRRSGGSTRGGSGGSGGGSGSTGSGSAPPPPPPGFSGRPTPSGRTPTATGTPARSAPARDEGPPPPPMIAARTGGVADRLGLTSFDPSAPFGRLPSFQDRAALSRSLQGGEAAREIEATAQGILALPHADRRAALESALDALSGRPGADLLESALYDALGL